MKKTVHLNTEETRQLVIEIIAGLSLDHDVEVRPHRAARSLNQNALYWEWVTIYAEALGHTKDELHFDLKMRHLKPIFTRDDEAYADLLELLREEWSRGNKERANRLYRKLIEMTSTTRAGRKQMAEYMEQVELEAAGNRCVLPRPADRQKEFEETAYVENH